MPSTISFVKYTSSGNKFVITDEICGQVLTESEKMIFAFQATDMYFGIGSDNFLVIQPCTADVLKEINEVHNYWDRIPDAAYSDYIFRMFEPDGKEAFSCGNGLLCISDYLCNTYGIQDCRIMTEIPTPSPKIVTIGRDAEKGMCWTNMGPPTKIPPEMMDSSIATPHDDCLMSVKNLKIVLPKSEFIGFTEDIVIDLSGFAVFTGEPHLVIFTESGFSVKELAEQILLSSGQKYRRKTDYSSWIVHEIGMTLNHEYSHIFPKGLNINFVRIADSTDTLGQKTVEQRTFERGVYRETWACGTGAVAASFVARHLNMISSDEIIVVPYLSHLRDANSQLQVRQIGEDYLLCGTPVFLFSGTAEFKESRKELEGSAVQEPDSSMEKHENKNENMQSLYGDSFSVNTDGVPRVFHFPVPLGIPGSWENDVQDEKAGGKKFFSEILYDFLSGISARLELAGAIFVLLLLVLGFNALLSLGSLKKVYMESTVSQYRAAAVNLQRQLQKSLNAGKDADTISGLNDILEQTKKRILRNIPDENPVSISVSSDTGFIYHSTEQKLIGTVLPPFKGKWIWHENRYVTTVDAVSRENTRKLIIVIAFGEKQIREFEDSVFRENMKTVFLITGSGMLFLIIALNFLLFSKSIPQQISKKIMFSVIVILVVASQIIFSALNIAAFKAHWMQIRGLYGMELISDQLSGMALDAATVIVISIFFFVEMLIVFSRFIEKRVFKIQQQADEVHYSTIRPVFFLLMFGLNISISFVPLHMEKLYTPIFGLSKDLVLSLPVSVSVFFTGIAFFIAGVWNDRRGWHEPFIAGVFLAGIGLFYAGIAPDSLHFILSRAVSGMGYGLFFMAAQGFIITYTDKDTKARGFASLFAALYAGLICGSSTGAMIAERTGYQPVFLMGALIILSAVACTFLFMRKTIKEPEAKNIQPFSIRRIGRFLADRNVLTVILFSSIPANMAMIGFLEYFNPVYLNRIGVSQSNIGRTFMLYSAFIIYAGPLISKYIDVSERKKMFMVAGGILGSLSFVSFYFFEGIAAVLTAIFFLGLSQSFVFVAQVAYLLKMKITREAGEGKAIATFRLVNRFGQAAGPMMFGGLVAAADIRAGVVYVGFTYLILTLLLLFMTRTDEKIGDASSVKTPKISQDE
ncbi:MAG: MFS transporter [Desulfobacterales bacterium]